MSARIVRAHYDELSKIASTFGQHAELTRKTFQDLRQQQEALRGGDWLGNGAQAFYSEMDSQVLPTINRLIRALDAANQTTAQIRELLHQAEDECAHILHGNGNGSAAGLAAAGAAIGAAVGESGANGGNGGTAPGASTGGMSAFTGPTPAAAPGPGSGGTRPGQLAAADTQRLPDAKGVKTYGDVLSTGRQVPGAQVVDRWGKDFSRLAPALRQQQARLDDAKAVLADTMKEQAAALAAARKNMADVMNKLNRATGGKAYALVKEYEQLAAKTKVADMEADKAAFDLQSAQHRAEVVKAATAQFEAGESKKGWEGKRDEIKAAVAEREKVFDMATGGLKSVAGGDVKGILLDQGLSFVKMVVTGMRQDEIKALAAADANIALQDEIMNKAAQRILSEQAAGAKADLDSATVANRVAQTNAVNAEKAQRDTLDQLAALEREHGSSHIFREMQNYDDQVRTVTEQVRSQNADYLKTLNRPPYSNAGAMARAAGEDIRHVETYGGGSEAWFDNARGTQRYLDQVARWQQAEVAAHTQLGQDLAQGKHMGVVDQTMADIDRAMGGNPSSEDLQRKMPVH